MFATCSIGALLVAALFAATPNVARAQDPLPPGVISVVVRDSLGRSIAGAELTVEGTAVRGVTDERGEIRFTAVRGGPATVRIRRLGFRPTMLDVIVDQRVPATSIVMLLASEPLAARTTSATRAPIRPSGSLTR